MTQKLTPAERAGKNLKSLLKQSEMTQEYFANEVMYVDPVTVRRWIAHGIKDINTIEQIADIFEVEISELLK